MNDEAPFRIVTVAWPLSLIEACNAIGVETRDRFFHIAPPSYAPEDWPRQPPHDRIYFFRQDYGERPPVPDRRLLASLEREDVPSLHNMIMSDRIVSKLDYEEALGYATLLTQRLRDLLDEIKPDIVLGAFDGLHGSLACAVAKQMAIPWFAPHFCAIPPGLVAFCDTLSPAARVPLALSNDSRQMALESLRRFEQRAIQAPAYIAPAPRSLAGKAARLPGRFRALIRTIRKAGRRDFVKFTEERASYSLSAVVDHFCRAARARKATARFATLTAPPDFPYVFFGLHMQPESTIDVWAPFFSNQMWVIELLARSTPASHRLLVKVHRSDVANYSHAQYERMRDLPSVELVAPFVDSRAFIKRADLVVTIQGTIGLEGALLGKPVIVLGDSPIAQFPSVSRLGELPDLPSLVRAKLSEQPPPREDIVSAYSAYLAPFWPASRNTWADERTEEEIDGYRYLFDALKRHVSAGKRAVARSASVAEER